MARPLPTGPRLLSDPNCKAQGGRTLPFAFRGHHHITTSCGLHGTLMYTTQASSAGGARAVSLTSPQQEASPAFTNTSWCSHHDLRAKHSPPRKRHRCAACGCAWVPASLTWLCATWGYTVHLWPLKTVMEERQQKSSSRKINIKCPGLQPAGLLQDRVCSQPAVGSDFPRNDNACAPPS